jgi:hypothetical protein
MSDDEAADADNAETNGSNAANTAAAKDGKAKAKQTEKVLIQLIYGLYLLLHRQSSNAYLKYKFDAFRVNQI